LRNSLAPPAMLTAVAPAPSDAMNGPFMLAPPE